MMVISSRDMYSDGTQVNIGDILKGGDGSIFIIDKHLGTGRYGKVFKVVQKIEFKVKSLACKIQAVRFGAEAKVHRILSHRHIVKFFCSYCSDQYCFIFMEYCKYGTLRDLVLQRKGLTVFESRYFFKQIIHGINYIHKRKIIHRDLKMDNIFLAKNMQIKIGDFGLARSVDEPQRQRRNTTQNKNHYKAPELFNNEIFTAASDIWAIGVILYKMVFNRSPFYMNENFFAATKFRFAFELENEDGLYQVLKEIFQPIEFRADARQCMKSNFVHGVEIPKELPETIRTKPIHKNTDSE